MRVDEHTFLQQYAPVSLLALTAHAMYYGEGDYANQGKRTLHQIHDLLNLDDAEQAHKLLDIASELLAEGKRREVQE